MKSSALFVPKILAEIGHRVPCLGSHQTLAVRHKLMVDINLVVSRPCCSSEHELCQKQKLRNAKIPRLPEWLSVAKIAAGLG